LESGPAASPGQNQREDQSQAAIDAAGRQRAIDALHRALSRLAGDIGRDWQHCGKAACLRSRRCRGFTCESETGDDEA
jgi:hypothetical protein